MTINTNYIIKGFAFNSLLCPAQEPNEVVPSGSDER